MIATVLAMSLLMQDSSKVAGRGSIKLSDIVHVVDAVADYAVSNRVTRPKARKTAAEVPLIVDIQSVMNAFRPLTPAPNKVWDRIAAKTRHPDPKHWLPLSGAPVPG